MARSEMQHYKNMLLKGDWNEKLEKQNELQKEFNC